MRNDLILAFVCIIGGAIGLLAVAASEWLERRRWSRAWSYTEIRDIGVNTKFGITTKEDDSANQ